MIKYVVRMMTNTDNVGSSLQLLFIIRCIGMKWPMDHVADGHLGLGLNCRWPYHLGLNCRVGHFRLMTSPGLKLPTQSQVADENIFKFDILKFMIS